MTSLPFGFCGSGAGAGAGAGIGVCLKVAKWG